jgi:hypothetical protein
MRKIFGGAIAAAMTATALLGGVAAAQPASVAQSSAASPITIASGNFTFTWETPVRRSERVCENGTCSTYTYNRVPNVTVTVTNVSRLKPGYGTVLSCFGNGGGCVIPDVPGGAYNMTVSVSGLGTYVTNGSLITAKFQYRGSFGQSSTKTIYVGDGDNFRSKAITAAG